MNTVSREIAAVAATAAFTAVMWIPIILNRLREMGVWKALKNPEPDVRPEADWAWRLANAHRNAIENLVVFAPLALAVHVVGIGNELTALASTTFVVSRIAHALIYTAGIPVLRTIAFFIGFLCQGVLALHVFGLV